MRRYFAGRGTSIVPNQGGPMEASISRRTAALGLLLMLVVVAVALYMARGSSTAPPPRTPGASERPEPDPSATSDGLAILYLKGSELHRRSSAGVDEMIHEFPAPDVFGAPGSDLLAYVTPALPILHTYDVSSGADHTVGIGLAPMWNDAGDKLAYLEPTQEACEGEACRVRAKVMVYDAASGDSELLLPEVRWGLLSWARDGLVLFDGSSFEVLHVRPGQPPVELGLEPSEFWDAAPEGSWLVARRHGSYRFERIGASDTPVIPIEFPGVLAEGDWAPSGGTVASVALGEGSSRLVLFSRDHPLPRALGSSEGAAGNVVWSADGRALLFSRVDPARPGRLQAVLCSLKPARRCTTVFSWVQGVSLLRLYDEG